jgi:uracil-DNA glycosylase family 4
MNPKYPKPSQCAGCDLEHRGTGFAPPDGPLGARLQFMAEALGPEEVIGGRPLIGAAGGVHTRILYRAGISREHTRAFNTVQCMPPGMWFDEKAPWYYTAMSHCAVHRQPLIAAIPDNGVLVTLGATALRTAMQLHAVKGVNVRDWHGTVNRSPDNRFWIVPTFHPSHLQRGAMNLLEVVTNDLRLADKVAQHGFTRTPTTLVVDPAVEWFAAWVDDHLARLGRDPEGTWLALDTEFPEKIAGSGDESEVDAAAASGSPITRYNVTNDTTTGITVPASPVYRAIIERLLVGVGHADGFIWYWNKYADIDHLLDAGHSILGSNHLDLMWLCHYLQSDIPRGLGFWAPFASDFGPWKHWSEVESRFGEYAAADAVQTFRIAVWAVKAAMAAGLWDVFYRDWHERDLYVLRPSREIGVPMNKASLEAFHANLQIVQARVLGEIKQIGAQGTLRPKDGYAKKPKDTPCAPCNGTGKVLDLHAAEFGGPCATCGGTGRRPPTPPKSMLGSKSGGKRKSEAKQDYVADNIQLVERSVSIVARVCTICGHVGVGPKHRHAPPKTGSRRGANDAAARVPVPGQPDQPAAHDPAAADAASASASGHLVSQQIQQTRWFWQLPFNPSSWQQILSYIDQHGHEAGTHRKTKKPTTDASSLKKLAAETGDPLYQLLLDGRAVEKVDSTYALGSLARLDGDDRLHPEITPKPATLRDSSSGPNLQNVIADKSKKPGLASGFRTCVEARDGIPPDTAPEDVAAWAARWGQVV